MRIYEQKRLLDYEAFTMRRFWARNVTAADNRGFLTAHTFATGTGLGPYISILKTAEIWIRFKKVVLVHGVPLIEELAYADLIWTLQQNHPEQFRFSSCVTREQNPVGLHGRMTDLLANGVLEKQAGLEISKEDSHLMLCGNHNMIEDIKTLLAERGMNKHLRHKPGHITTEQYF